MAILHLSRLRLDPSNPQVRAELSSPYEMHRTLSKAFASPSMPVSAARDALGRARMLFRVDQDPAAGAIVALIQSLTRPDWRQLTTRQGYLLSVPETRVLEPCFGSRQRLAFRLRANPTVKRGGKRRGLYREEEQVAWLTRKAEKGGFVVEQAVPRTEDQALRMRRKGMETEHLVVRFDGILQVRDPARFVENLAAGIGSAKGFGFGLLSLAPLRAGHA